MGYNKGAGILISDYNKLTKNLKQLKINNSVALVFIQSNEKATRFMVDVKKYDLLPVTTVDSLNSAYIITPDKILAVGLYP